MAIDEIAAIVERGRPAFDNDGVLRRAVERCLEIIGEAAKSVSPSVTEAHPEIPWSDLAKVRDRLSHHYHRVDHSHLEFVAPMARCVWSSVWLGSRRAPPATFRLPALRPVRSASTSERSRMFSSLIHPNRTRSVHQPGILCDRAAGWNCSDYAVGRSSQEVQQFAGTAVVDHARRLSEVCGSYRQPSSFGRP
jgi:hypothetical protein